jgi:hypothetical protein
MRSRREAAAELRELALPEIPIAKSGVWHAERLVVGGLMLVFHDIEIERPRSPFVASHATVVALDDEQRVEQFVRRELRLDGEHLIQIVRLWRSEWRGFLDVARGEQRRVGQTGDGVARNRELLLTMAEVRPERHVRDVTHPGVG